MFTFECFGDIALFHTIDDLNLVDHFAILEDLKARAFNDQIVLIPLHKLLCPDLVDKFCVRVLFGII